MNVVPTGPLVRPLFTETLQLQAKMNEENAPVEKMNTPQHPPV